MTAPALAFDPRPLVEPVDRTAARDFARRLRAEGRVGGLSATTVIAFVVTGVFGVVVVSFIVLVAGSVLPIFFSEGGASALLGLFAFAPFALIAAVLAIAVVLGIRSAIARQNTWYRLDRFARANGMTFVPTMPAPALPGLIFGVGDARQATDLVRGERPRFVEFANYRYTTGSGKERTTHSWGYVAVKLDAPLPNIVLDATSNNGVFGGSNLPASLDRAQRLSLEGDFDRYFSLYCPAGYERDALYLFTPDIMARFVDNAAALDVEIADDWLLLYARRDLSTLDPAMWAWLFSVVGALLDKLAHWARWRDERLAPPAISVVEPAAPISAGGAPAARHSAASALPFAASAPLLRPPPGVAAPGRRLRRRVPVATIVAVVVFVLFWLFTQFGGLAGLSGLLPR